MELIKELPAVFEDFAEARRNAFVNVKKVKDQGIPVIGSYCTYFPQELAIAAGAATGSLLNIRRDDRSCREGSSCQPLSADQVQLWIC